MRVLAEGFKKSIQPRLAAMRQGFVRQFCNRTSLVVGIFLLFSLLCLPGSADFSRTKLSDKPSATSLSSGSEAVAPALPSAGGQSPAALGESSAPTDASAGNDRGLYFSVYRVSSGDTLSDIAETFNITLDTIVSFNGIRNARTIQPGSLLKIPSMSGVMYTAKAGDTASGLAQQNSISPDRIIEVNGLLSPEISAGAKLFLPDAKLASFTLREISGDLFQWPARGWISSWYGWRSDPFTGSHTFHNGIDIGVDMDTPVHAAMEGVVEETGYNSSYGNYILVSHHAGWATLYGHLETISVHEGQHVDAGQRIAFSGNTGYSTGPHLHFSVFKYGRSMNPFNVLH